MKMKKLLSISAAVLFFGLQGVQAQNCDAYEIKLNQLVQKKGYTEAYPVLQEALEKCPGKKVNYYIFGETILDELAQNAASDAERQKYAQEIVNLLQKRIAAFPNDKPAYWRGEIINYELANNLKPKKEIYEEYKNLFNASENAEKLSTSTVLNYFTTALELLNEGELQFDEALKVYFKTKEVTEKNIELRSAEYGKLAEKLDSLQTVDPNKKLTKAEEQTMANAQAAKDSFLEIQDSMEGILSQYTTCDNIAPMYVKEFEAKKEDMDWIISSYQELASKECYDTPIMDALDKQYAYLWKLKNPQATETASPQAKAGAGPGSAYAEGARAFSRKDYKTAISKFQDALNDASGSKKGDIAYYIAVSYSKTGNLGNAVNWAKKAASYKPGYGAPYELIASIFGSNANSCGSSTYQKLTAYWVAADFANKACAVDSRSCGRAKKMASSYNAHGPSLEMSFQQGKKKGDRVSVSCFGGASTVVR
ncbi:hypothetical protein Q785_06315 [Ornithobacterium rhinotracheale ORT-UMN 88]|uniref:Tetratricopeptide repeat protein n=2 Tax=Ornithobacterium rhinotracheale TaxID=28251 RepID=I4A043_ORNRL|nr:hypothetical protein Ornrh_1142 [Ornithobacterium rhinotracheale DSM 15997]AIQ00531.1 hypothetical protein Q785_06315 [Ornithobacterium rhinotracheale ORT-UMN 88]